MKEFVKTSEEKGNATIYLSTMSTDFEFLSKRLKDSGCVEDVFTYEEKEPEYFPDLAKYKVQQESFVKAIYNRIKYTKKLGKYEEEYIPEDLKKYDEIYVFCDSDPIGYYLNYKHIKYHAVEDGLNTLRGCDAARCDNTPHFGIKTFLSKRLNWIFVQNGYGRYCIDMEVNDISVLQYSCPYYKEVSRAKLYERLTDDEKEKLLKIFVKDEAQIRKVLEQKTEKTALILTEPLCKDLSMRKKLFNDLISEYKSKGYQPILKQHPRDLFDYNENFPDVLIIDRTVPMEMLNFFGKGIFDVVVSIFTELDNVYFGKEKLRLGRDFMDPYEEREAHEAHFESKR